MYQRSQKWLLPSVMIFNNQFFLFTYGHFIFFMVWIYYLLILCTLRPHELEFNYLRLTDYRMDSQNEKYIYIRYRLCFLI